MWLHEPSSLPGWPDASVASSGRRPPHQQRQKLEKLRCHWRLHECDINPAALQIISAGIRAGQSSQPGAEEETGATSGLSCRSCTHVVQSRLGERMPASIKKKKKISQLLFFFFSWSSCSVRFGTAGFGICGALRGDGSRGVGITVWHVWALHSDPAIKTNPPVWWKPCFY